MSTGYLAASAIGVTHPHTAMPRPLSRYAETRAAAAPCGGLSAWRVRRVLARIDADIDGRLQLAELAAVARLSCSYFSRAFKVSLGETPHAYIMRMRMEHAKRLMLEEATPLAEIALSCGLADQAHLSRMFRQIVGESPNAWRRRRFRPEPSSAGRAGRIVQVAHAHSA